jgi:quercetin dioxygenase-like cupin family protein
LIAVFAGTAFATAPNHFVPTLIAKGGLNETGKFSADGIKLQTKGPVDLVTVSIDIAPGGSSGWHYHPGVVLVTVKSGTVTFFDQNCSPTEHRTGTSFVESDHDVGLARNLGDSPAVVIATFIVPRGSATRIDELNAPACAS